MKLITLLTLISLAYINTVFGQTYQNASYAQDTYNQQYNMNNNQNTYHQSGQRFTGNGDIKMLPVTNTRTGMLIGHMPVPSSWNLENNILKGPNGITAGDLQGGSFMEQQRRLTSANQVAREDIFPKIQQVGGTVTNTFPIPEIAQYDRQMSAQYWKVAPTQDTHEALGIEFQAQDGTKALAIIHFTYSRSQYGNMSMYYLNQLSANAGAYEQAKKAYIYALANFKMNPQYIAAHNQREQQKSQASWSAHNQRMRNNEAAFQARQKAHVDTYNSMNQMSMDAYNNRNNSSDRIQEQFVDGVWEQQNMIDPYTGENVKVEGYYNQYYMNNNNQYIGTDNYNYNPNLDPNLNNTEWRQAPQPQNNNNY